MFVFIALFLSGGTVNISALLSVVMLVGLVVNNNILLLEPTIEKIASGVEPSKALWDQYIDKYRMMLMTTIAVMTGMLPQLFSSDIGKVSMAAVLIGGMAGSLFWSFAVTPSLFMLIERARQRILKLKK